MTAYNPEQEEHYPVGLSLVEANALLVYLQETGPKYERLLRQADTAGRITEKEHADKLEMLVTAVMAVNRMSLILTEQVVLKHGAPEPEQDARAA